MILRCAPTSLSVRAFLCYQKILRQLLHYAPTRSRHPRNRSVSDSLYRRISPLGEPKSIVPALDEWIREGNSTNKSELQRIIKELTSYQRHKHALEVSLWMANKRQFPIAPFDVALRLRLLFKVSGLEQAENYFNKIPEHLKTYPTYITLLNFYTLSKSVDKAESTMRKIRDLGYATKPIGYNLMMNMHCQLKNRDKVRDLLAEMEEKGIQHDSFTLSICLGACAAVADVGGMDNIVTIMESKPNVNVHWRTYVIAVEGYLGIGSIDKAMKMLNKLEEQLMSTKKNSIVFVFLLKLYAEAGKRDELYRIWNLYKRNCKVINKVYNNMIRSLIQLEDIEGAEKIFEEWESSGLSFDFRVPNLLINAYCLDGLLEKAEGLITRAISKGGDPIPMTWCHLAGGYLKRNQVLKAIEALKKAVSVCPPKLMFHKDCLTTCLEYLEEGNGTSKAEDLINILRTRRIPKEDVSRDLCGSIEDDEFQLFGKGLI